MPELPPPLPPGERTVGQLVAETIRAYGAHFWRALPLGVPLALATQIALLGADWRVVLFAFTPAISLAFVAACALVHGARWSVTAWLIGIVVFGPVPFLVQAYLIPAVVWLALFGLAVPAAMVESLGFRAAIRRGRKLATADFAHAMGSLSALIIVVVVSALTLIVLLRSQSDTGERVAHLLADVVLSPLLYLGGALLYFDQAARVGSRRSHRRSRDADLHPPVDTDAAGRADPQVEP